MNLKAGYPIQTLAASEHAAHALPVQVSCGTEETTASAAQIRDFAIFHRIYELAIAAAALLLIMSAV